MIKFKQEYERLKQAKLIKKHASMDKDQFQRAFAFLYKMKTPKTAAQHEALITEYVSLHGGICTKVSTMGRQVVTKQQVTDVLGRKNSITDSTYIPSTTRVGTSDLIVSKGISCAYVEIKIGKDRQSEAQKKFEQLVRDSGGVYVIIKTLDDFAEFWNRFNLDPTKC